MDQSVPIHSDDELALRISCGEEDALRTLIREHGPKIQGYLHRRFPRVAEDAWQRLLIGLKEKINRYDSANGKLEHWLLRVAQRCALSALRAEAIHTARDLPDGVERDERRPPTVKLDAKQVKQQAIRAEKIREAVASLPPKERRVIETDLANWNGKTLPSETVSSADLAVQWGDTTANAIDQARFRGRSKLRRLLTEAGLNPEDITS